MNPSTMMLVCASIFVISSLFGIINVWLTAKNSFDRIQQNDPDAMFKRFLNGMGWHLIIFFIAGLSGIGAIFSLILYILDTNKG